MSQEELVVLLQKKDPRSFDYLYDMYAQNLYGVIFNILKDTQESEDTLQEVFVKIWNSLPSYDAKKGRFFTWILNIARNLAIDKYRSKAFNNQKKNLITDNFVDTIKGSYSLGGKTDAIGLHKYVNMLKPLCIKIIDLLFFKGFTQKEASEELEIPLGTLKTRNRACINELRNIIED